MNRVLRRQDFSVLSIILLSLCAVVWLTGPFLSFYLSNTGDGEQFSVIEYFDHGGKYVIGEITDTDMYRGIVIIGITITAGFIFLLIKLNIIAGIALILGDIIFVKLMVSVYYYFSEYIDKLSEVAGTSAWGTSILLLITGIVAIYSGYRNR